MTPSDAQAAAIRKIVAWYRGGRSTPQVFYLAGYAGTGKSTIFKVALEELQRWGLKKHVLATFTGKAASVLRKKGNLEAQTFHSAVYIMDDEPREESEPGAGDGYTPRPRRNMSELNFQINYFGAAAEADLIALDECSMLDEEMVNDALSLGKKILVMGDPGQLPPVGGEGYFQKLEPDVMLTEVHRQALDSPILRLATMAREGKVIPFGDYGAARVLKLTMATQHEAFRQGTWLLCGIHRVRKHVTRQIRHIRGFGGTEPMAGEPIICGKNNRERNLFNGLEGVLLKAPTPYRRKDGDDDLYSRYVEIDVRMDDHRSDLVKLLCDPWQFEAHFGDVEQPRMKKNIEWMDWGYARTVHKAQGSEAEDVTVIDDSGAFGEHRHRHAYTAYTRASERLTVLRRS